MTFMADRLTLDAPRRTKDGFLAVRAKAARTGVYQYGGSEVDPENKHGLRDTAIVNVLRDENTVFDATSAQSFIGKPITDNHPSKPVTSANWRDHARGTIMGALRDGDYLAFDLLLTDADAIAKVDAGKRELSNGYDANLEFGDFKAADGTVCQARQTRISGNHVALVDHGRAGSECRIADAAPCEAAPQAFLDSLKMEKPVKTMLIDGLTVDVSNADTAEATIKTLVAARDAATGEVTTLKTSLAAKDIEIAGLKTENQQLKDAKPTPAQLLDAAKGYAQVCDKAKALGVTVTDAMDESAIMKAVVAKVMGDSAKDWNDEQIAASFAVATKDMKPSQHGVQPLGDARVIANDAVDVRNAARDARYAS
jgi:hypothetical protein